MIAFGFESSLLLFPLSLCRAQKLSESQELLQRGPVPCPWGRNAKQPLAFPTSPSAVMPMQWSLHKCPIHMPRFRKLPDWQKKEEKKAAKLTLQTSGSPALRTDAMGLIMFPKLTISCLSFLSNWLHMYSTRLRVFHLFLFLATYSNSSTEFFKE